LPCGHKTERRSFSSTTQEHAREGFYEVKGWRQDVKGSIYFGVRKEDGIHYIDRTPLLKGEPSEHEK